MESRVGRTDDASARVAEPERAFGVLRPMLPIRIEPQLLTPSREPPEGDRWIHEVKYDGYRLLCRVEHGRARLFTRPGNDWTHALPGIAAAVEALETGDAYLDGELVAIGPDGVPDFDALRRSIGGGRGALPLVYQVFDALYAGGRSLMGADLLTRKRVLAELVRKSRVVRYTDHLAGGGAALYRAAKAAGLEGIVSKRADSTYRPGVRSRDWQKVKCFHRYTFTVAAVSATGARLSDEAGEHVGTVPIHRGPPVVGQLVQVQALWWRPGRRLRHAAIQGG